MKVSTLISDLLFKGQKNIFLLCITVLSLKIIAIWFYYIPPFNVMAKLAMLAILIWFSFHSLYQLRHKKWMPFAFATVLTSCILFLPLANDSRIVGLRYRAEFEMNNLQLLRQVGDDGILLSSGMGESVYLRTGSIPDAKIFMPQGRYNDGCYGELTQIANDFYIDYDVCPSGTGILIVSIFLLNFIF